MNTQEKLTALYDELKTIERNLETGHLSFSDQQLMDQAWEDITNQLETLEALRDEPLEIAPPPPEAHGVFEHDTELLIAPPPPRTTMTEIWNAMTDAEREEINNWEMSPQPGDCQCDSCRLAGDTRFGDGGTYDEADEV